MELFISFNKEAGTWSQSRSRAKRSTLALISSNVTVLSNLVFSCSPSIDTKLL